MSEAKETGFERLKQSFSKNKKFWAFVGIAAVAGGIGYKYYYLPNKDKKNGAGCDSKGGNPNGARDDVSESRRTSEPRKEASGSTKAPRSEAAKGGSKSV